MFAWLFKSIGLKRKLASLISIVAELAKSDPALLPVVSLLQNIAGVFGFTGLAHATVKQSWKNLQAVSIASLFAALLSAVQFIPQLSAFTPFISTLAALIGALGLGAGLAKK